MATDSQGQRTFLALGGLLLAGLLLAFVLPKPVEHRSAGRVQVRLWHMWTAEWKTVVDEIVERFNRSQDKYEVIALSVPGMGGADTKFVLAVAGGDPPDVMAQWNPVIPSWVEAGLLQPLDAFMTPGEWATLRQEMYPVARKIGVYRDRLYGVTTGLNLWACYYLPAHFREAGLDPDAFPTSLEDLFKVGARLDRFEGANLTRMGFMPQLFGFNVTLFGPGFYDETKQEVTVFTPENLRALTVFSAEQARLGFDNVARFQAGINQFSFAAGWPFIGGHYSICLDGQWRVEQIARYAPELEYRTAPMPPPAGGRTRAGFSNGNFMVIPVGAKCPDGAWDFIKFWSGIENPERAAEIYVMGGWLPLKPAIVQAPAYQAYLRKYPQFQTFVDLLSSENIQVAAPVPYTSYLADRVTRANDMALQGLLSPEKALRELETEVRQEQLRRKEFGYVD